MGVVKNAASTVALPSPGPAPIALLFTLGIDMSRQERAIVVREPVGFNTFEEAHVLEAVRKKEREASHVSWLACLTGR